MKITPDQIEEMIDKENILYHCFPGTTVTICYLPFKNGWSVTGDSACVDPKEFNKEQGEIAALNSAISKVWGFAGYELFLHLRKQKMLEEKQDE